MEIINQIQKAIVGAVIITITLGSMGAPYTSAYSLDQTGVSQKYVFAEGNKLLEEYNKKQLVIATEPNATAEEPATEPNTTTEEPATEPNATTEEPATEPNATTEETEPATEPNATTETKPYINVNPKITTAKEKTRTVSDISKNKYRPQIQYILDRGIVDGYADGTFKPDGKINRAEFTKIIINTFGNDVVDKKVSCFKDVDKTAWFAPFVCYASEKGIIKGYDGNLFKPTNLITYEEASKIIVLTAGLNIEKYRGKESLRTWASDYTTTMGFNNAKPGTVAKNTNEITRGEMAFMIGTLLKNIENLEHTYSYSTPIEKIPTRQQMIEMRASGSKQVEIYRIFYPEIPDSLRKDFPDEITTKISQKVLDSGKNIWEIDFSASPNIVEKKNTGEYFLKNYKIIDDELVRVNGTNNSEESSWMSKTGEMPFFFFDTSGQAYMYLSSKYKNYKTGKPYIECKDTLMGCMLRSNFSSTIKIDPTQIGGSAYQPLIKGE